MCDVGSLFTIEQGSLRAFNRTDVSTLQPPCWVMTTTQRCCHVLQTTADSKDAEQYVPLTASHSCWDWVRGREAKRERSDRVIRWEIHGQKDSDQQVSAGFQTEALNCHSPFAFPQHLSTLSLRGRGTARTFMAAAL
ncbi:hypothetical protein CHARACLAT_027810 [Characodon lateralis]|uniref:Uncharacterized protein n=1 Tax=Characodon lateralis TaxID=208331 RepID=A0ABU7EDD0_9TELE|nr:hypothetical protein [Characodon lateralis]